MTNTRAFLFACTAGLAAATSAHAAPVEYVRVCSLYGEGFYYVPGSDTCLKVGGYVRAQYDYNAGNAGIVLGSGALAGEGRFTRATNHFNYAHRAFLSLDSRTQTQYGTLRTYIGIRWAQSGPGTTGTSVGEAVVERALIQFAGLTFGRAQSFFDMVTFTDRYNYLNVRTAGDTKADGINLAAYTAEFGNGVSLSLAVEEPVTHFRAGIVDGATAAFGVNGVTTTDNAGTNFPDFVANLRINQAWGNLGISGALHDAGGLYFGAVNSPLNGHPDNKLGWAISGGGELKLPGGDTFGVNAVYSEGAAGYATKGGNWQMYGKGGVGVGWITDGLFDTGREIELTRVWSVNAAYEHVWNPQWRTSLYGGYVNVSYNDNAKAIINSHLPGAAGTLQCGALVAGAVWPPIAMTGGGAGNSCTPDFSFYQIGARTEFSPAPQFGIGLDVFYTRLNTAYKGVGTFSANSPQPATTILNDQDIFSAIFRVQRSFYP